jgi:hypothetical protein
MHSDKQTFSGSDQQENKLQCDNFADSFETQN